MIERYTRPEMARIWTLKNKYQKWLDIEILVSEALSARGKIPASSLKAIRKASFSVERIAQIEEKTRHDVIAFLTNLEETVGPEARFIHQGLTSSDILDTGLALQLKEAGELILSGLDRLMGILKKQALRYKFTVMIGRSHGIHAEPITFGLKMALIYAEMSRNRERLVAALKSISFGKISGAVGTFAHLSPEVEAFVLKRLRLSPAPISNQVLQRDRHAQFFTTLAILGGSLEKLAVEMRHLQRTEVLEVEEYFSPGQKGSSAMPHKRNPIGFENISGLARLVRSYAVAALENMPLWHERDISHSSVERVISPDATILLDYMLDRTSSLMEKLLVYPERMLKNLHLLKGLIHSQQVLLLLTEKGLERQKAYEIIQRNAMEVWKGKKDFRTLLAREPELKGLIRKEELDQIFDPAQHLKAVDTIFDRVFGTS
jgi:adenylosuccinate lyase